MFTGAWKCKKVKNKEEIIIAKLIDPTLAILPATKNLNKNSSVKAIRIKFRIIKSRELAELLDVWEFPKDAIKPIINDKIIAITHDKIDLFPKDNLNLLKAFFSTKIRHITGIITVV